MLGYALISVLIVSLVSFIGVFALGMKEAFLQKLLLFLVALSTGALIGDAFLHLLPEAVEENGFTNLVSFGVLAGVLGFFVLEKVLRWRHCHDIECIEHPKHLGLMNLFGDGFHNFIDGALIGASYLVSIPLGIATTLAVIFHEIPQELGDFGVLLHSGFTKTSALLLNFFSASLAILGALAAFLIGRQVAEFTHFMLPFTVGGFLYIALSGLVPELHRETKWQKALGQLVLIIAGIMIMYSLLFIEVEGAHSH